MVGPSAWEVPWSSHARYTVMSMMVLKSRPRSWRKLHIPVPLGSSPFAEIRLVQGPVAAERVPPGWWVLFDVYVLDEVWKLIWRLNGVRRRLRSWC